MPQNITDRIDFWLSHNLKNYLDKGNSISESDVDHIKDWFNSKNAEYYIKNIQKISVPQALQLSEKWIKKLNKKTQITETDIGTEQIKCWDDGMRIVKLVTEEAYKREGKLMSHCVATYAGLDHSIICSLRNSTNIPVATIEIKHSPESIQLLRDGILNKSLIFKDKSITQMFKIGQIKGRSNESVPTQFIPYVKEFILSNFNIADMQLSYDLLEMLELTRINNKNFCANDIINLQTIEAIDHPIHIKNLNSKSLSWTIIGTNKITISNMSNLESFTFPNINAKELQISSCDQIKELSINAEYLDSIQLSSLPNLETLYLSGNINNILLYHNQNLKKVSIKSISNNISIENCNLLKEIAELPESIERLSLSANQSLISPTIKSKINTLSITSCPGLKMLDLTSCNNLSLKNCQRFSTINTSSIHNSIRITDNENLKTLFFRDSKIKEITIYNTKINTITFQNSQILSLEITNQNVNSHIDILGENSLIQNLYIQSNNTTARSTVNIDYLFSKNEKNEITCKYKYKELNKKHINQLLKIKDVPQDAIFRVLSKNSNISSLESTHYLTSFIHDCIKYPYHQKSIYTHTENGIQYISMKNRPIKIKLKAIYSPVLTFILNYIKIKDSIKETSIALAQLALLLGMIVLFFIGLLIFGFTLMPLLFIINKKWFKKATESFDELLNDFFTFPFPNF